MTTLTDPGTHQVDVTKCPLDQVTWVQQTIDWKGARTEIINIKPAFWICADVLFAWSQGKMLSEITDPISEFSLGDTVTLPFDNGAWTFVVKKFCAGKIIVGKTGEICDAYYIAMPD